MGLTKGIKTAAELLKEETEKAAKAAAQEAKKATQTTAQSGTHAKGPAPSSTHAKDPAPSGINKNAAQTANVAAKTTSQSTGSFYSQPTLGTSESRLRDNINKAERTLDKYREALEDADNEAYTLRHNLWLYERKLQSGYADPNTQQEYVKAYSKYRLASNRLESANKDYQFYYNQYSNAAQTYNSYMSQQQEQYNKWRSTIREPEATDRDISAVDRELESLQKRISDTKLKISQMSELLDPNGEVQNPMQAQLDENNRLLAGLNDEAAELTRKRNLLQEEAFWYKYLNYADKAGVEDFADKSRYVSTANDSSRSWLQILTDNYSNETSGWDDPLYEFVNGNEEAGAYLANQASAYYGADNTIGAMIGGTSESKSEAAQMTEGEVAVFNYLYATEGKEAAHEYYDFLKKSTLNQRQRQEQETWFQNQAKESPVGSSVYSVMTAPLKGLSYVGQAADYISSGTVDQNAGYNVFSYSNSAIRSGVSEKIEQALGDKWGKFGSWAYQTGMSMADFLFNSMASGGSSNLALAIMGTGAAADATIEAKERGLSDNQAFTLGTVAGLAEVVTEKVSLDTLLDKTSMGKSAVGYILKNVLAEGSEEVGSDLINLTADILIAKDESQWRKSIAAYQKEGCSENEAFVKAFSDQAKTMALDFAGGAVSGGIMAAGGVAVNRGTSPDADSGSPAGAQTQADGTQLKGKILTELNQYPPVKEMVELINTVQQAQTDAEAVEAYRQAVNRGVLAGDEAILNQGTGGVHGQQAGQNEQNIQATEQGQNGQNIHAAAQGQTHRDSDAIRQTRDMVIAGLQSMDRTPQEDIFLKRLENAGTDLQITGILNDATEEQIKQAQRISDALGKRIEFWSESATENGVRNGKYSRSEDTIYLNTASGNLIAATIGHELTHSVEMTDAYNELSALIQQRVRQTGGDWAALRLEKKSLYARNGVQLSQEEVDQELVAEYIEKNFVTDEQSIMELAEDNRSLCRRILDWLNNLLAKFSKNAQERQFIQKVRDTYQKALQQSRQQNQRNQIQEAMRQAYAEGDDAAGDALFDQNWDPERALEKSSFAGPQAAGANLSTLAQARKMQAMGIDNETIRKETGWFEGADGKMRWEIDDSKNAEVNTVGAVTNGSQSLGGSAPAINSASAHTIAKPGRNVNQQYSIIQNEENAGEDAINAYDLGQARMYQAMGVDAETIYRETGVRFDENGEPVRNRNDRSAKSQGQRMSENDIQTVHRIGRKSVNSFTTEEIQATERLAKQYWKEMGVKSPFFRAWFGDWRVNDRTPVQIADQHGQTRGVQRNEDTGWDIQVSGKVFNETRMHTGPANTGARVYLPYINDIIKKAVLLDSYGVDEAKSVNSLLMHNLYAVADIGNGPELLKLYVEEMNDPNADKTAKRAYQLQNIESQQLSAKGSGVGPSPVISTADIRSIADLFAAVKQRDSNFQPKPASKAVNEDGTPKIYYHGTNADWYAYDLSKNVNQMWGDGIYLAETAERARAYGDRVIPLYVRALYNNRDAKRLGTKCDHIKMRNGDLLVFSPEQIKSAEENIGTFDGSNQDIRYSISSEDATEEPQRDADITAFMPGRIKNDLRKAKSKLTNQIAKVMQISYYADRSLLKATVDDLAQTYFQTGTISEEDANHAFEKLYAETGRVNYEVAKKNKPVMEYLSSAEICVSEKIMDELSDDVKEVLNPSVMEGANLDSVWNQLSEMAPDLFRSGFTDALDRLERIAEVYQNLKKVDRSLREYYSDNAEMYCKLTKSEFDRVMDKATRDFSKIRKDMKALENERDIAKNAIGAQHIADNQSWKQQSGQDYNEEISEENEDEDVTGTGEMLTDDESARQALRQGYPVLKGEQIIPFKTWVLATDPKLDKNGNPIVRPNGEIVRRHNYGLVTGFGDEPGTLAVSFHNKHEISVISGETKRMDDVNILYEDLTPVPGVYQMTKEEFQSLMESEPEELNLSPEELREIESMFERLRMDEDNSKPQEPWSPLDIADASPKSQAGIKRAERKIVNKVGEVLNVPYQAKREFLKEIVHEAVTEYLREGTISQKTVNRLFDTAYEQGVVVDTEFYDQYKEVKDYLRTTSLTISQQDQADIADYGDFKKRSFGTLRIRNEGGLPVDTAWMELQEMAPALFPENITHPTDQLQHMLDVGKSIHTAEKSLQEYYGSEAETFKKWARNDFDATLRDAISELRDIKRFEDDLVAPKTKTEVTGISEKDVATLYSKLKKARRNYEKAAAKNFLNKEDNQQVSRLLRGEIQLEHLNPEKDNVAGITAVYEAKREYEDIAQQIRSWNKTRKSQLMEEADGLTKTANGWKDKKVGALYSRETMERNVLDIVDDPELAKKINDTYFKPVHDAAAKATRAKNQYRDRVRALNISQKVDKGNQVSESYAVQLIGEAEDNIRVMQESRGRIKNRDGKSISDWRGIIDDLWKNNPNLDRAKVENAVAEFRKIYDDLFQQMNESRIHNGYEPVNYRQGYFPHFQATTSDGIFARFGQALGIETEVTALPTSINGLTHTFRPGIQWFGNAMQRKGFETAYDAVTGFDKYIEGVADVIYQTENIQRLRALASQLRYRTTDEGIRQQVDEIRAREDLADVDKENRIKEIYEKGKFSLSNFVVELDEYTNLLANKKSREDRNMEQAMGRNMYNVVKSLESRVAANMVAINPASWLTNFIPLTQGGATLDRGTLLQGMWRTLKAYKNDDGIVDMSSFLTNRRGSDPIVKTWQQGASATLSKPLEWIDSFTADSLVRARYQQNLNHGLSEAEAMSEADQWAAGVMADRSKGSMPTLFNRNNPLTKIFTQFQLEVNNQLSYVFKDMPREKRDKGIAVLVAALFKFALGAFLYNEVYEYFVGRRPALDPIGILNDTVGDFTGYELPNLVEMGVGLAKGEAPDFKTEKTSKYDAAANLATNVAEEMPFVGSLLGGGRLPINSAIPNVENLGKAIFGTETEDGEGWSTKKRVSTAMKEISKPLTYTALPFGGGQVKKIWEGVKGVIDGGSYTVDNEGNDILQYPIYTDNALETAMNAGRAILFGKTTLSTGVDWVESGFQNLTAKETAAYQDMTAAGISGKEAYSLLKELKSASATEEQSADEVKRDILKNSDISDDGKAIIYYGLLANDSEREMMDAMAEAGADTSGIVDVMIDIRAAEKKTDKLGVLASADVSQEAYEQVAGLIMGTDLTTETGNPTQYADFMNAVNAGLDPAEALALQVEGVDLGDYVKYTDAGLKPMLAKNLTKAMNELEPLEGEDSVTPVQKWRAAVDLTTDPDQQMQALQAVMDADAYSKTEIAYDYGVEPKAYVRLKEILPQFDENGNGSFTQAEITAAINSMCSNNIVLPGGDGTLFFLTGAQKAALWQLYTGAKSAKNNPYDKSVGQAVIDERAALKEAKKAE